MRVDITSRASINRCMARLERTGWHVHAVCVRHDGRYAVCARRRATVWQPKKRE